MSRTPSADLVQLVRRTNPWLENPSSFVAETERRQPASWIARHLAGSERWPVEGRAHLVIGARQVGKTSWLWRRLVEAEQVPLVLDGAEPIVQEWASSPGLAAADLRDLVQPGTPILLDEAQHLDEAGLLIKGLIDSGVPGPLYVTGSSSFHLLARTRESLAGRAVRAEMHPLSLHELAGTLPIGLPPALRQVRLRELALRQAVVGGYPAVWLAEEPDLLLDELLSAFVLRDASDLFRIDNLAAFRRLIRLLAGQAGDVVNLTEWAASCEVSRGTVGRYLDLLEEMQVVQVLRPFAGGRRAETTGRPKVYFRDPGLRLAALGAPLSSWERRSDRGKLLESLVAAELRKQVHPLRPGEELMFWRTRSGAEVDFVVRRGDDLFAIEVKAGALRRPKISRSLRSFVDAYAPKLALVIHTGEPMDERLGSTEILFRGPDLLAEPVGSAW